MKFIVIKLLFILFITLTIFEQSKGIDDIVDIEEKNTKSKQDKIGEFFNYVSNGLLDSSKKAIKTYENIKDSEFIKDVVEKTSDTFEDVRNKASQAVEIVKENEYYKDNKNTIAAVAGGTVVAGGLIIGAPAAAAVLGFGAAGIEVGSVAASLMSVFGSGSTLVASLQSIGAVGGLLSAQGGATIIGGSIVGGAIGGATIKSLLDDGDNDENTEEQQTIIDDLV